MVLQAGCQPIPLCVRRPCEDDDAWDPGRPLAIRGSDDERVDMNEHVAHRIKVHGLDGKAVEGQVFDFDGGLAFCVVGGLWPATPYRWEVTDGTEPGVQEWDEVSTDHPGTWFFSTAATTEVATPGSVDACRALTADPIYDTPCDAGDTGADSGDTGDSGVRP